MLPDHYILSLLALKMLGVAYKSLYYELLYRKDSFVFCEEIVCKFELKCYVEAIFCI